MKSQQVTFNSQDWIVHRHFGIGQIQCIEVKKISGEAQSYYRADSSDGTFWIPVDQIEGELIRPLATPDELQEAVDALARPPRAMQQNHILRNSRIQTVRQHNTPLAIARLIRDLRARRRERGDLNRAERSALKILSRRLINEWSLVRGIERDTVEERLERLLDASIKGSSQPKQQPHAFSAPQ